MTGQLIAVIDDESEVISTISEYLTERGYKVKGFLHPDDFLVSLKEEIPDLIILDVMFPDANGFDVCRELRKRKIYSHLPIIILSAKTEEQDKVFGLRLGADDYVAKPFSLSELHARLEAILKRSFAEGTIQEINIGDIIVMHLERHEVTVAGEKVELTPTEFKILECLLLRKDHAFTRSMLLDHIWGEEKIVTEQTIDVHIKHLREKLGQKAGNMIKNIRGIGYKIEEPK